MSKKTVKPWLSISEQIALLTSRGMSIHDEGRAARYLSSIGYYRLSGYLYCFRDFSSDNTGNSFYPGTTFEELINLYIFDKKLRLLAMDALERIEVMVRAEVCNYLGRISPIAHKSSVLFHNRKGHKDWLVRHKVLITDAKRANNAAITHYIEEYHDIPIWVAAETWNFGTLSKIYDYLHSKHQDRIAANLNIDKSVGKHIATHLRAFNYIRNVSSHHARLWNTNIIGRPSLKGMSDECWKQSNINKSFVIFCLMYKYVKTFNPNSTWGGRFLQLLDEFPIEKNNQYEARRTLELSQMGATEEEIKAYCGFLSNSK